MTVHEVPGPAHRLRAARHEPVLTVRDGDEITFTVQEGGGGQFDTYRPYNGGEVRVHVLGRWPRSVMTRDRGKPTPLICESLAITGAPERLPE